MILWELFRFWLRVTPRNWWKRKPFLPMPTREYMKFRLHTMYGENYKPKFFELVKDTYHFGKWLRMMRRHIK